VYTKYECTLLELWNSDTKECELKKNFCFNKLTAEHEYYNDTKTNCYNIINEDKGLSKDLK